MNAVREVLRQFNVLPERIEALGNRDGFSGALLWRCETSLGPLCLRAWPPAVSEANLRFIHHLQMSAAELPFVPRILPALDGNTALSSQGRLWELTQWLPGHADEHDRTPAERVASACTALARLHLCWERLHSHRGPCPAITRRLDVLRQWQQIAPSLPALDALGSRALRLLDRWEARVPAELSSWQCEEIPLQPCLCDVWRSHILFEGNDVSGIIDYGEAKIDHVAVDLARLLGSTVEDDAASWSIGLSAYRRLRPFDAAGEILARALDRTGTILGVANWVRWLYHDKRPFEDRDAARQRLGVLVARLERW